MYNNIVQPRVQDLGGGTSFGMTIINLSDKPRWGVGLVNVEGSNDVGSDFVIGGYDNAGSFKNNYLYINRSNGQVSAASGFSTSSNTSNNIGGVTLSSGFVRAIAGHYSYSCNWGTSNTASPNLSIIQISNNTGLGIYDIILKTDRAGCTYARYVVAYDGSSNLHEIHRYSFGSNANLQVNENSTVISIGTSNDISADYPLKFTVICYGSGFPA